jgi:peptide/nickel transport system substrate-binding protein
VDRETVVISSFSTFRGSFSLFLAEAPNIQSNLFTIDVDFDPDWRPFAQGVESLPSVRDGTWKVDGERMVLTWKIRARKWHDGRPRTQITQQLFGGRQPVAHSYLPTRHPGNTEHVQRYPYDLSRARVLLKEAGFTPGPDGILRNAAGQRMTLELNTTLGIRYREQVAQLLQAQLAQAGIEVVVRNVPGRVLVELTGRRKFTMAMYSWILSPESDCNLLYTSADIPGEVNHWSGQNHPGYRNPEMDRLCISASGEIDPDRRRALLQESTRLFARDLPALPLYFRVAIVTAKSGLQNHSPSVTSALEAWNAHTWYWK